MMVSIVGCGWFGSELAKSLIINGIQVKGSTTTPQKLDEVRTHLVNLKSEADSVFDPDFFDCNLLVMANNVRMTDETAYLARSSFTTELIKRFNIPKVIFISSTSVYGEPNATIDETTIPQPETLSAKLLYQAEQLFQNANIDCIILRFAGLIGPGREPGKFFAGKRNISNGLAPVNLLHLDDAIGITIQLIAADTAHEIINAVSPFHPSRLEFYSQAARQSCLESPVFIEEKKQWKIVSSRFNDYQYKHNLLS